MRVRENPIRAADLVPERLRFFLNQHLPSIMLLFDDRLDHLGQSTNDVIFLFPEGGLVGNLKQVSHCFGAFTVETAHGQTDFTDRLDDLIDKITQDQSRQVQHRRSAHTGADIGWARGQISESRVVSEIELALEGAVDFIHELESIFQLQTRANRLHPQMIFFVDHDAERLPAIHHHATACALCRVFATYQVAID